MSEGFFSRGFSGRRRQPQDTPLPPGQYLDDGFPVLSAGPTPRTALEDWTFSVVRRGRAAAHMVLGGVPGAALGDHHQGHPLRHQVVQVRHRWEGVSVDTLLDGVDDVRGYVSAFCDGGYTTNLPLADVTGGKAWVAYRYDGEPLAPEHGGPARLLVPHLYFWKSAKWVRGLRFTDRRRARLLGVARLPQPWRPLARAALLG